MSIPVATKKLITIVGATAVGKTEACIRLATRYKSPVLSADSRQCYRELGIATAKPTKKMLAEIPHYFINSHSIHDPVTAADFERYALKVLEEVYSKGDLCLMAGGSGLYIKALCDGLDEIPPIPPSVRSDLEARFEQEGLDPILSELEKYDPELMLVLDKKNPRRVIRAMEVYQTTGKPISAFRRGKFPSRPFEIIKVGLMRDRKELYQRIDQRVEYMMTHGLLKEAKSLYAFRKQKPLQTVGYKELFGHLEGRYELPEAVRLFKRNSRRYAKRQLTWFSKDPSIQWFPVEHHQSLMDYLDRLVLPKN